MAVLRFRIHLTHPTPASPASPHYSLNDDKGVRKGRYVWRKKNQFSADFVGANGPHASACPIWYFVQSIASRTASLVLSHPICPVIITKPWNRRPPRVSHQIPGLLFSSFFFLIISRRSETTQYIHRLIPEIIIKRDVFCWCCVKNRSF